MKSAFGKTKSPLQMSGPGSAPRTATWLCFSTMERSTNTWAVYRKTIGWTYWTQQHVGWHWWWTVRDQRVDKPGSEPAQCKGGQINSQSTSAGMRTFLSFRFISLVKVWGGIAPVLVKACGRVGPGLVVSCLSVRDRFSVWLTKSPRRQPGVCLPLSASLGTAEKVALIV